MGNLNCLSSDKDRQRSEWYDEWQNNSSYVNPYDYYNRRDFRGIIEGGEGIQNMPIYHQGEIAQTQDSLSPLSYNQNESIMYDNNNGEGESQELCDNVTEAFLSHWFVREEAELTSNIKELEKNEHKIEFDNNNSENYDKKVKNNENISLQNDNDIISKHSSDSGMCNLDDLTKKNENREIPMGFSTRKNGYCCYTAYVMCSNTCEWDNFLNKTARIMTGLQRQFHCTIRFSDKICFHRGNSVRTFQIIGNDKANVIKCKVALPQGMVKLLITPMSGSTEVEEYSKECISNRGAINRRK